MFTKRIERRINAYRFPVPWYRVHGDRPFRLLHTRYRCSSEMLAPGDMGSDWHCCNLWHRKLHNKWNSNLFARHHGCQVPEIYWKGYRPEDIPFESLPEQYVVKPIFYSGGRQNVYVIDGQSDLMRGEKCGSDDLINRLNRGMGWIKTMRPRLPIMVQEYVAPEPDKPGVSHEHKIHVFAGKVGAIENIYRTDDEIRAISFYTPDWKIIQERVNAKRQDTEYHPPPGYLDDLLKDARAMGSTLDTYARIDFLLTEHGYYFGEMTFTPRTVFTRYGDELFNSWWVEMEQNNAVRASGSDSSA